MKAIQLIDKVGNIDSYRRYGKITRVVGLLIESRGPSSSVGDVCYIHIKSSGRKIMAEVVGFQDEHFADAVHGGGEYISGKPCRSDRKTFASKGE